MMGMKMKKKKLEKKIRSLNERLRINENNEKILWEMMKNIIIKNEGDVADFLPDAEVLRTMHLL